MDTQEYFNDIEKKVKIIYDIANSARAKGFDPKNKVEIPLARSMAEKVVALISTIYPQLIDCGVDRRILELEKEYGKLDSAVAFKIAEEVAKQKYCKFSSLLEAMSAGARIGFAYITLGVVSSPIEGLTELKIGKTKDGKEYILAYFSGPIRSAGTTATCVALMIIDYLRELFGYSKYDPSEEEVKRYVTENYDYHERVTNLQYLPSEKEITYLAENLPIQIAGEPTEDKEVSNYKDLARVESNFIRGGMCLIFSEGLAQKAQKGLRLLKGVQEKGFVTSGWDYLEGYVELKNKKEKGASDSSPTYIKDLVAGRPVFGHPAASGSFRFRYGRSRTCGFSAMSVHPATMGITNSFISTGTQLKIEKPTKGCAISVSDGIDGPIVKMKDGSVLRPKTFDEALEVYPKVEEILYLGDILVPFGDVANRNYELIKPGYVEEWWNLELQKANSKEDVDYLNVGFEKSIELSKKYSLPLYPAYIYFWSQIKYEQFLSLIDWIAHGHLNEGGSLVLPFNHSEKERFSKGKRALELIGCEHNVTIENVVINPRESKALLFNIGVDIEKSWENQIELILKRIPKSGDVIEIINKLCSVVIKDKAGSFIGARMGRPEKAKLRKLTGSPHVIFPVGAEGGRLRSFQAALDVGFVQSDFPLFYCSNCKEEVVFPKCEWCGADSKKMNYCPRCDRNYEGNCPEHEFVLPYKNRKIDIRKYFEGAKKSVGLRIEELPAAVKGVRGTSSEEHRCEYLAKGLLRAKYNLHVNKDGTIRYDMTEMPLTHFKPREIGTSIKILKKLGYEKDIFGNEIEDVEQTIEIFPHDIILPSCPYSGDDRADETFVKVSQFVDDELEKVYGLERHFNANTKEEIIGELFACIAPHICTAVVGRLIGFSKTQTFFASPYIHAAMRRDCDGDEAAVMLLMDMLLNFSRKFLPAHRGGTQDAPLVLNSRINAGEVDDQILDFEAGAYPLELYELAEQKKHSSEVKIENIKMRLKGGNNPFINLVFTHNTSDINGGALNSSYKSLPTMGDKVEKMMELCKKIRAVDTTDVARLVIERHFIRDIRGNFRKFSMQVFRCVGCNEKYRRPPLVGKCTKCGGKLIFTISEGSILKYMQGALNLANTFGVSSYLIECLDLVNRDIEGMFGRDAEKQEALSKWF